MVAAATPTPAGWAICRMPIARPRRPAGNQPTTTRPLATLLLAAARPASPSPSASSTTEPDIAASDPRTAAPTRPASSTSRSPRRSVTIPHGTSATITPAIGAAATRPASARVSPSRSCSTGIRNAGPCTITAVDAWATVLAASIAHRRRTPTSAARSMVAVTRRLKPLRRDESGGLTVRSSSTAFERGRGRPNGELPQFHVLGYETRDSGVLWLGA